MLDRGIVILIVANLRYGCKHALKMVGSIHGWGTKKGKKGLRIF
jgi:hypothetical protein